MVWCALTALVLASTPVLGGTGVDALKPGTPGLEIQKGPSLRHLPVLELTGEQRSEIRTLRSKLLQDLRPLREQVKARYREVLREASRNSQELPGLRQDPLIRSLFNTMDEHIRVYRLEVASILTLPQLQDGNPLQERAQ
jgi:hypothetical protein